MKGRFSRRAAASPYAAIVPIVSTCAIATAIALPALLSGCSLFRPVPPPSAFAPVAPATTPAPAVNAWPTVPVPLPTVVPPRTASKPVIRPAPKKPPRQRPRKHRKSTLRQPSPPAVASAPQPAPIVSLRAIDRAATRTLLDSDVQRPDGKVIGQAVDVVVDARGRPAGIVVNLQGFGGVGDRKASFAWNLVRVNAAQKEGAIALALAPGQPVTDKTLPASANRLPMLDAAVERANGTPVGRIVDVLLDGKAMPQALVLDVGGGVLHRRRAIAVDWSALRFATKNGTLRPLLDLSDAQIDAAPPYASDQPVRAVSPPAAPAPAPAPATSFRRRGPR